MNVHHLELFYYVARHGGVSAAARHIPYGIQQPAISAQIIQLEDSLGTTLFHRRPFQLTKSGADLYAFITPFFDGLPGIGRQLRGGLETRLRIGAPETIQRDFLPVIIRGVKKRVPDLTFTLMTGRLEIIEAALLDQEIDLGFGALAGKRPAGVKQKEIVTARMMLIVPEKSGFTRAESFWQRDRIDVPLIALPSDEPVCRQFQQELRKRKIEWFPSLELNSQELVARYVAEGFGVGLALTVAGLTLPPGLRMLPLDDFPAVSYGALWLGNLSPLQKLFIESAQKVAIATQKG